jgi:hypothetical protein
MPTLAFRLRRPRRVSRLAADHQQPPPRVSAPHLHRALQPRAPPPRTRAALARVDKRGPATERRATERRRDQAPRPTRRTDLRIPPRRSMNRLLKPLTSAPVLLPFPHRVLCSAVGAPSPTTGSDNGGAHHNVRARTRRRSRRHPRRHSPRRPGLERRRPAFPCASVDRTRAAPHPIADAESIVPNVAARSRTAWACRWSRKLRGSTTALPHRASRQDIPVCGKGGSQ